MSIRKKSRSRRKPAVKHRPASRRKSKSPPRATRSTKKQLIRPRRLKQPPKFSVLIADDLEIDRWLLKDAFRSTASRFQVVGEVGDGEQVIDYLAGRGEYSDRQRYPFPDVLLIDLMMPRKNGFEVLEWLQQQSFPKLKVVPMAAHYEIESLSPHHRALRLRVEHFYSKSVTYEQRLCSVKALQKQMEEGRKEGI
jgi:CheY-like chemotaxis protein